MAVINILEEIVRDKQQTSISQVSGEPEGDVEMHVSTSALINEQAGVCPKCTKAYTTASIANGDTVHYCTACRTSSPMPDAI